MPGAVIAAATASAATDVDSTSPTIAATPPTSRFVASTTSTLVDALISIIDTPAGEASLITLVAAAFATSFSTGAAVTTAAIGITMIPAAVASAAVTAAATAIRKNTTTFEHHVTRRRTWLSITSWLHWNPPTSNEV